MLSSKWVSGRKIERMELGTYQKELLGCGLSLKWEEGCPKGGGILESLVGYTTSVGTMMMDEMADTYIEVGRWIGMIVIVTNLTLLG
jgi:hypothetical protein